MKKFAREFLNDVSYFRFIKAYSLGLKPKNGNYYEGVAFDQLVELYRFNSNLRALLFPLVERVEINLRCRISNYFCTKYGVLGYKDKNNFFNRLIIFKKLFSIYISDNEKKSFFK